MKTVERAAFAAFLREVGLAPGRPVLIHSFLASLGKPETSAAHDVIGAFRDVVGPSAAVVAPCFTYSYFNGEVFDVEESASQVGAFGDLVRAESDAVRGLDPNFSNAGVGDGAAELLRRDGPQSFGGGSFYDKLVAADGQIALIGVDFTALPLFMHIERIAEAPYRYEKRFEGVTRLGRAEGRREIADVAVHYVRDEKLDFVTNRRKIGAVLDAGPATRQGRFGYGAHRVVSASAVVEIALRELARDPHILIDMRA